jgi:signal transduction histidine kinase
MPLRLVLWPAGLALGGFSLVIARDDPAFSFAGTSLGAAIAFLGAGYALLTTGLLHWQRRPGNAVGPLLAAAACAWFLAEWDNPGVGSALVFTIGLALAASCPPLVGWAMLAYPGGRLSTWWERGAVAVALAGSVLVLGVMPALFFDPVAEGCAQCPRNLLLAADKPDLANSFSRIGVHLGLAWSLLLLVCAGWQIVRSSGTRRRLIRPVVGAGGAYLGLVAAGFAVSLDRGFLGNGTLDQRLWLAQAGALAALTLAVAWSWLRARRTRSSLTKVVVELGESAGGLREALAQTLADPELEIAYPVGDGRYSDAAGAPVDVAHLNGRAATPLVRDGRPVAILLHRAGLLDSPELVDEVASTARLALENERLQAEARAQLADLRASRARIVEAGDEERRRLERDLHDGAQQRLVGLSLALRLLRSQPAVAADSSIRSRLDEADVELRAAIADLRTLAHGLFPAVLADEGLAAAVQSLAEEASVPVVLDGLPEGRFGAGVESAAYAVVAESAREATGPLEVHADVRDELLHVEVAMTGELTNLGDLEDRIRALEGSLLVYRTTDGRVRIRAEIPCAS